MMSSMTMRSSAESLCRAGWVDDLAEAVGTSHVCKLLVGHAGVCVCMCSRVRLTRVDGPRPSVFDLFVKPTDGLDPAPTDLLGD